MTCDSRNGIWNHSGQSMQKPYVREISAISCELLEQIAYLVRDCFRIHPCLLLVTNEVSCRTDGHPGTFCDHTCDQGRRLCFVDLVVAHDLPHPVPKSRDPAKVQHCRSVALTRGVKLRLVAPSPFIPPAAPGQVISPSTHT